MPALAITDFTNLCGLVKFYGTAHGAGMKPIVGADFHVQSDLIGDEMTQISVLAMNNTGYQNLTLLISKAYQRGYGALGPWIDRDWLAELNEGLLLISGGRMGDVGKCLLRGNSALVDQCVSFYEEYFPNRYYLELIRTGRQDEESYLHAAVRSQRSAVCLWWPPTMCGSLRRVISTRMRFAWRSTMASRSTIRSGRVITPRNSTCAARRRCVSSSPISPKRWKTA